MRQWIGSLRLLWIALLLLIVGLVVAQDDLAWLLDLLPDATDVNVNKLLSQSGEGEVTVADSPFHQPFDAVNSWAADDSAGWYFRPQDSQFTMFSRETDFVLVALDRDQREYDDVVISVDTMQETEDVSNSYGLVCRAEDQDNGYHFYISGDGLFAIQARVDGEVNWLLDWTMTELINLDSGAVNRLTAVCVQDYFAFYINGTLAAEARDHTFQTGLTGMVLTLSEGDSVTVNFDNLWIWEANAEGLRAICRENEETIFGEDIALDTREADIVQCLEQGNETIELGGLVFEDDFDDDDNWGEVDADDAFMGIDDDLMLAAATEILVFTSNEGWYEDVVVQIDTRYVEGADNNAYGLACHANVTDGLRGYYFNISADGFFSVWISDGDSFRFVVNWERSEAIVEQGDNRLMAICADDYLAFYVNNTLLAETYNSIYTSGSVGMILTSFDEESVVQFDNIRVWEATLR